MNRKGISLDMTAMCDVAFLLLTFFILTTKFKPEDPVVVEMPSSVSDTKLPDNDIMTITIDKDGAVFFGIDGQFNRDAMLENMLRSYNVPFTDKQRKEFSLLSTFGVPIEYLPEYLNVSNSDKERWLKQRPQVKGIPIDSANNQLRDWVVNARYANTKYRIAIKGDGKSDYKVIKRVIDILQDQNINKFNLITNMEERPSIPGL